MPNQGRQTFNASPSLVAAARAGQGIPQEGAVPAPVGGQGIEALLAALGGGKLDLNALLPLLALLLGSGQVPEGAPEAGGSSIEEAFLGGGGIGGGGGYA